MIPLDFRGMIQLITRFSSVFLIFLLAACAGPEPIREIAYPVDCKSGMVLKELVKRGDRHRNRMMRENPPKNTDLKRWTQVRKIHAIRARACYQYVLDAKPDHSHALLNKGFTHLVEATYPNETPGERDKSLATAANLIQQVLSSQKLDAQAYYYLGEISARRGQCEKATRIFKSLLTSGWSYSHVYVWTGYCRDLMGKPKEAQEFYKKAVELSHPAGISDWARSRVN